MGEFVMTGDSTILAEIEWEYRHFTYNKWQRGKTWVSLSYQSHYVYPLARRAFWEDYQAQIQEEISCWQSQGWEPAEPVSQSALHLHCREYIDRGITASDVVLWVATLGVALLVTILAGGNARHYVAFETLEYRLLMRRRAITSEVNPQALRESCLDAA